MQILTLNTATFGETKSQKLYPLAKVGTPPPALSGPVCLLAPLSKDVSLMLSQAESQAPGLICPFVLIWTMILSPPFYHKPNYKIQSALLLQVVQ